MNIDKKIIMARNGSSEALNSIKSAFGGLVYYTAKRVHSSFGHKIQFDELHENAKQIFDTMLLMEYDLNGKAEFPYYIKRMLYAKLIQEYRPIYRAAKNTVCIENHLHELNIQPDILNDERARIYYKLLKFAEENFDIRECALIDSCILGDMPHSDVAKKYHISQARVHQIYEKMIEKLRNYLANIGIRKGDI